MAVPSCVDATYGLLTKRKEEIFHIIDSAIVIAAMRWPEDFTTRRHKIAEMLLKPPVGVLGYFSESGESCIAKDSDATEEENYKTTCLSNVAFKKRTTNCKSAVGDKKKTHLKTRKPQVPDEKRIQKVDLDGEAVEKKLQLTKRKLRQWYEHPEVSKTQKRKKVIEFRDEHHEPKKPNNGGRKPRLD